MMVVVLLLSTGAASGAGVDARQVSNTSRFVHANRQKLGQFWYMMLLLVYMVK